MQPVSQIMTREHLVTLMPSASVAEATRRLRDSDVSHLMVVERDALVGVVCMCDLDQANASSPVAAIMGAEPFTIEAHSATAEAARSMLEAEISCLPVLRDGCLVGVVTISDLVRAGVVDLPVRQCASCGSTDHVRCEKHGRVVGFCLECTRRSEPPRWDDDLGGG
jgi:acetoin utilization protein AcuB